MDLSTPIKNAGLVYKLQAKKLEKLNIFTVQDVLLHIPARYVDLSLVSPIQMVQAGEVLTVQGTVSGIKNEYTRRRFQLQKAQIQDNTGVIECVWFNQPYITKNIHAGDQVSIAGKAEAAGKSIVIRVKEYEILIPGKEPTHTARLVPVYPETRGLSSKWIRNRVRELLERIEIVDYLPESIRAKHCLIDLPRAITQIHFPDSLKTVEKTRERLAFDELFLTQLKALFRKKSWEEKQVTHAFEISPYQQNIQKFWELLPFELTHAQKRAVSEIFGDLSRTRPMNRLLEGDVGSGKTVVATIALYLAHLNGFQGAFMAPTEILAYQHYETVSKLLSPLGVEVVLYTASNKKQVKYNGSFHIAIGTHALLSENVMFDRLGLVVIDEQQRFGVEQRAILRDKGTNPHFLTMTATPIPRTVLLTLYGDLDLSYLDEMPKGRKVVKTWYVPKAKREAAYEWIKKMIRKKHPDQADYNITHNQVFVVCPFIEESESNLTVKAATKEFEQLRSEVFSEFRLGLLHGKQKAREKQEVLTQFQKGELDILVATPVVEVGVDIPNATIMLIEGAERFGLAQLHQLRGRVGRRGNQAYCLLFSGSAYSKTIMRLKLLEKNHVGAVLAEEDLRLRGPGEIYGTRQHGEPVLKVASFSDFPLIEKTKHEAEHIIYALDKHPLLKEAIESSIISRVNPD